MDRTGSDLVYSSYRYSTTFRGSCYSVQADYYLWTYSSADHNIARGSMIEASSTQFFVVVASLISKSEFAEYLPACVYRVIIDLPTLTLHITTYVVVYTDIGPVNRACELFIEVRPMRR